MIMSAAGVIVQIAIGAFLAALPTAAEGQASDRLTTREIVEIREAGEALAKAILSRDWRSASELYVDDAVLYPAGEAAVKGRVAIEACLAGLPPMADLRLRTTRVEGSGDVAYVQGTYLMTLAASDGAAPAKESGYFLDIRRKQPDGRWLIAVHMLTPHQ